MPRTRPRRQWRCAPIWRLLLAAVVAGCPGAGKTAMAEYLHVPGVIDTRTTYSDGCLSVDSLATLALGRGYGALFVTDHDRLVMEYGLFPVSRFVRRRETRNAIHNTGADGYLAAIGAARKNHPDLVVVSGCESGPYYYWSGSVLDGSLTAHDAERQLLALGLEDAAGLRGMPVLHNGFSTRYLDRTLPPLLLFLLAFLISGLVARRMPAGRRWVGGALAAAALLLAIESRPFRSSPWHPYMGDQGIAPYQHYIDHVEAMGGMTLWNHTETRSGVRRVAGIRLSTPPHPEVIEQSTGYTGFSAVYGDTAVAAEPGRHWDRVLGDYCRGQRARPPWAVATADFHCDGGAGEILGNFTTVFLATQKTRAAVLDAMRAGRMYAVRGRWPQRLALEVFQVEAEGGGDAAVMGREIELGGSPVVRFRVSSALALEGTVRIRVIRDGLVRWSLETGLPAAGRFVDDPLPPGRRSYYRLDVHGRTAGTLVSNPVFVIRKG